MQHNTLHFWTRFEETNFALAWTAVLTVGIYGCQNSCIFDMSKQQVATQLKGQGLFTPILFNPYRAKKWAVKFVQKMLL
jgi:hypothetical protein